MYRWLSWRWHITVCLLMLLFDAREVPFWVVRYGIGHDEIAGESSWTGSLLQLVGLERGFDNPVGADRMEVGGAK